MKNILQICRFSNLKTITAIFFLTSTVFCITQQLFAQFTDDFSDGDYSTEPSWTGTDSKFNIVAQELKLEAPPSADFAYLSTPSRAINQASWELLVRLDFNPSNTNYARVYITSDQADLSSEQLNGYYILVGNTTDDVSLYKQEGAVSTKIIDGSDGRLDHSIVSVKIKLTRDDLGYWELLTDVGPTFNYTSEGSIMDATFTSSGYFGIFCSYTSTRSDKFYFDDFLVTGNASIDISPPELGSVEAISSNELLLVFSESVDKETAEDIFNYSADSNLGNPTEATIQGNSNNVLISFEDNFSNGHTYTLSVSGVRDHAGNSMNLTNQSFLFFEPVNPKYKDIVFTEILADPSPKVRLPEAEFAEVFNRSTSPIDLNGWQFTDGSSSMMLPDSILLPGEYLILTSLTSEFNGYGKVIGSSHFPSLNNSGDILILKDFNGTTVDSISYSDSWYQEDEKKEGGWSLELIDPENLCSEAENWDASESLYGGTPGSQNSIDANKPDLTGPTLLTAIPLSPTILILTFNEKLEKVLPAKNSFHIEPSIEITHLSFLDLSLKKLQLTLSSELNLGVVYSITANAVYDCSGNPMGQTTANKVSFGLTESAVMTDVAINEILFNPRPTGVDFVEIVNTSSKFINLKNWSIANLEADLPKNARPLSREDFLLKPGAYLVMTESLNVLKGEYPNVTDENVLVIEDLPSFNDDAGSVTLVDPYQTIIDFFYYTDNLHSIFINDDEGVSLERIAFSMPASEAQNWKSASSLEGFATPGYLNSNARNESTLAEESIKIDPEVFIPVTGQPDFTQIHYKFDHGGYVANIKIFDERGYLIKRIANNEVLGTEGALRWDGDKDDGSKVRTGYYMIWVEVYDNAGMIKMFQKRVAVGARF